MYHPPILTYWNSTGEKIKDNQVKALKKLLKMSGALSVRKMPNDSIQSKWESWKKMEKANIDILTPLQILFGIKNIEMTFGTVEY